MRIRTIKPEFWSHPVMARCSEGAQLLAIGLLNYADDHGYFAADSVLVRSALRPYDETAKTTEKYLTELQAAGWWERRTHPSRGVLGRIPNFDEHQRVDRARESNLEPYWAVALDEFARGLDEASTNDRRSLDDRSSLEGKGKEQGKEGKGTGKRNGGGSVDEVFEHWRDVMQHPDAKLTDKREKAVKKRIEEGYTAADLKRAVDGCSKTPHNIGQNETGQRWDDLELICRSGENVERFKRNATDPPRAPVSRAPVEPQLHGAGPVVMTEVEL